MRFFQEELILSRAQTKLLYNLDLINLEEKNHLLNALFKINNEQEMEEFELKNNNLTAAIEKRLSELISGNAWGLIKYRNKNKYQILLLRYFIVQSINYLMPLHPEFKDYLNTALEHAQQADIALNLATYKEGEMLETRQNKKQEEILNTLGLTLGIKEMLHAEFVFDFLYSLCLIAKPVSKIRIANILSSSISLSTLLEGEELLIKLKPSVIEAFDEVNS